MSVRGIPLQVPSVRRHLDLVYVPFVGSDRRERRVSTRGLLSLRDRNVVLESVVVYSENGRLYRLSAYDESILWKSGRRLNSRCSCEESCGSVLLALTFQLFFF